MDNQAYIARVIKESNAFFGSSFSNRYMNAKRYLSVKKAFERFLLKKPVGQPIRILEVGTGNGWMTFQLSGDCGRAADLSFFGIDLSPLDIDFALERKKYFGLNGFEFRVMDARTLDFKDLEFDLVICSELIEHISEPETVLKEIRRVLKDDGFFIMTSPNKDSSMPVRIYRFFKKILGVSVTDQKYASLYGISGVGNEHVSVHNVQEWSKMLKNCGFKVKTVRGTGGMFFGSRAFDKHRVIFAFSVLFDVIVENLPYSYLWSELLMFELEK